MKLASIVEGKMPRFAGYFVKNGKIYDVTRHIDSVTKEPEKFGLTKEHIDAVYKKHGEQKGREGKSREELIKEISKQGWIRVRHYLRPVDYWSIQCDNYKKRRKQIQNFIFDAMEKLGMSEHDHVSIIGYFDGTVIDYPFQKGGVKKYLMNEETDTHESSGGLLLEFIVYMHGHKNSKGEIAPYVIRDHKTKKILSSHKTQKAAREQLKNMHIFK